MDTTVLCKRCNTENNAFRKFCSSCGAPLGLICDRCGSVNRFDDKFCGICGLPSVKKSIQSRDAGAASVSDTTGRPKQYNLAEIKELLMLRYSIYKEEKTMDIIDQNEIDKLFG